MISSQQVDMLSTDSNYYIVLADHMLFLAEHMLSKVKIPEGISNGSGCCTSIDRMHTIQHLLAWTRTVKRRHTHRGPWNASCHLARTLNMDCGVFGLGELLRKLPNVVRYPSNSHGVVASNVPTAICAKKSIVKATTCIALAGDIIVALHHFGLWEGIPVVLQKSRCAVLNPGICFPSTRFCLLNGFSPNSAVAKFLIEYHIVATQSVPHKIWSIWMKWKAKFGCLCK
mmetsp:Transcript_141899/g.257858  ORF Transcript_141899/g.257858 Transcript_141899/m.257858 type:complete len:228 (+) Transcript_141899:84-767(+)